MNQIIDQGVRTASQRTYADYLAFVARWTAPRPKPAYEECGLCGEPLCGSGTMYPCGHTVHGACQERYQQDGVVYCGHDLDEATARARVGTDGGK